jgi:hypothetical protein
MAAGWKDALMADTGAPWNIPYVEPADLVRDYPAADEAQALAIAAGLSVAGGLVAFHSVTKTDTFTSGSVAAGGNTAVTGLSLTNIAAAQATNKFIITAFFGVAATSHGSGAIGIAINDGTSLISIGDTAGSRTRVTAGGLINSQAADGRVTSMPSISVVYTPGDTSARTFSVHALNIQASSRTLYVNRNFGDTDDADNSRGASVLHIMEVRV